MITIKTRLVHVSALVFAAALPLFLPATLAAQEYGPPGFLITLVPSGIIGLGEYQGRDVGVIGGAASLSVHKGLGGPLLVGGRVGVSRQGFRQISDSFSTISLLGSTGLYLSERPSLAVVGEFAAGLRIGSSDTTGLDAGLGLVAEFGADSAFGDRFRLGARLGYEYWIGQYHGIALSLTGAFAFRPERDADTRDGPSLRETPAAGEERINDSESPESSDPDAAASAPGSAVRSDGVISVSALNLSRIFPVFYKYYNEQPVGSVEATNESSEPVRNVEVQFNVPRYMDAPRTVAGPSQLLPGKSATIPFTALFADTIMTVTTDTVATAQLTLSYDHRGQRRSVSMDEALRIANRNAMTWDDNRKAAAFVTPNDPALQVIARGAASVVRDAGYHLINEPLRFAMGVYEALRIYGLQYVVDPNTPYTEYSAQEEAVDYLQFPGQTIQVQGGDCDDLSICYAAALHAIGHDAAFITIPGHIFAAVDTGLSVQEARREFSRLDDLVVHEDAVWIPVELTILEEGFLRAWQQGAKQWREHSALGQAELYPVAGAAAVYEPAGLRDDYYRPTPPDSEELGRAYSAQIQRYIEREIFPQVARLQEQIAASNNNPRHINRLGVLYARYDLADRARIQFELILENNPRHVGALVNLGNLHFLAGRYEQALSFYERGLEAAPGSTSALLGIARANHELENYGNAARAFEELKSLDPALADRFAYLEFRNEEASRAAATDRVWDVVVWVE